MRALLAICAATAAATAAAVSASAHRATAVDSWAWRTADPAGVVSIGRYTTASDLEIDAHPIGATTVAGRAVSLYGSGGNFELEHSHASTASRVAAVATKTGQQVPLEVGRSDGQDLVPLRVLGGTATHADLQEWTVDGATTTAIDAAARLRIGPITLTTQRADSRTVLVAILPDGARQVLVPAS